MRAMAHFFDQLSYWLHRAALAVAIVAVLVLLASSGWQVIARYLLSQPPPWTEELARFAMVWAGLLGASCAFRQNADPSLFPDLQAPAGWAGKLRALLRTAGVVIFVSPILWYCFFGPNMNPARGYLARLLGRQAETMDVPMIVFGMAIPMAFIIIVIHLIAKLICAFAGTEERKST